VPAGRIRVSRRVQLRYDGTDTTVPVELASPDAMLAAFEDGYRRTYSFLMDRPLIAEAVTVEAVGLTEQPELSYTAGEPVEPVEVRMYADGAWRAVPLYQRDGLRPGDSVTGPAIVAEANATTVVDDGWRAAVTGY